MYEKGYHLPALRKGLVATLLACALLLTSVASAHAESVSGSCTMPYSTSTFTLVGNAHYAIDGAWHTWYLFAGYVAGTGRNSNNINFYFYQDYQQNWTNFSPDNIHDNQWYSKSANIRIPASSIEQARFEAIFDVSNASDPRCSAWSSLI